MTIQMTCSSCGRHDLLSGDPAETRLQLARRFGYRVVDGADVCPSCLTTPPSQSVDVFAIDSEELT